MSIFNNRFSKGLFIYMHIYPIFTQIEIYISTYNCTFDFNLSLSDLRNDIHHC